MRKLGADLFAVREQTRTAHHRPDFAKVFLDGVPPTYTAAFLDPYAPSADHGAGRAVRRSIRRRSPKELAYSPALRHQHEPGVRRRCLVREPQIDFEPG
ncbi:hypothetical protein AB0M83_44465 [Amycolatopsis sp. NPDC051106]|uniref:hypothetical protein n=1 Tax=Amycolatopsis sp. NPDC051106 TaxID=3157100 RepID=UPI00342DF08F